MMRSGSRLSIVICTHNRARYLPLSLESLTKQAAPEGTFEVLLVDNNSSDETRDVAEKYAARLPDFRYIFEDRQGLSQARNRGTEEANGSVVAFLDDDAAASSNWVIEILRTFSEVEPRPACVGGPVDLNWEGARPNWIAEAFLSLYTQLDLGPSRLPLHEDPRAILMGANMAFDRETLRTLGGFSTNLGRKGKSLISGEETRLLHQLRQRGLGIYYCPEARVSHLVLPERRNRTFFRRRVFADGQSQILMDLLDRRITRDGLQRRLAYDLKRFIIEVISWGGSVFGSGERRRNRFYFAVRRWGRIRQLVAFIRQPAKLEALLAD